MDLMFFSWSPTRKKPLQKTEASPTPETPKKSSVEVLLEVNNKLIAPNYKFTICALIEKDVELAQRMVKLSQDVLAVFEYQMKLDEKSATKCFNRERHRLKNC